MANLIKLLPLLLAGCTTITMDEALPKLVFNPFDTVSRRPDVLLTGGIAGRLIVYGKCIQFQTNADRLIPLWPEGTTLSRNSHSLVIALPDSRGKASVGDHIKMSGSILPTSEATKLPAPKLSGCTGTFFTVSRIE